MSKFTLSKRNRILILTAIFILSLVHCFFSMDWDEQYTILVGYMAADGYSLFGDIWSAHQTSSMFLAPLIFLWKAVFSVESIILGTRILSVTAVFLSGLVILRLLKDVIGETKAFLITAVYCLLLPRGTISLEYGLLLMVFVSLSLSFLLHAAFAAKKQTRDLCLSALFWSCAVLTYPFFVLVTVVYLAGFFLLFKTDAVKKILLFILTCFGCACLFFALVLIRVSPAEFTSTVGEIFSDAKYGNSFIHRLSLNTAIDVIKKTALLVGASVFVGGALTVIFRKAGMKKETWIALLILLPFAAYPLVMAAANVTGLYTTGCMGLSVGYFFFFLMVTAVSVWLKRPLYLWLCLLGFLVCFTGFAQGNLHLKDYFNYLYVPLFLGVYLLFALPAEFKHDEQKQAEKRWGLVRNLSFVLFLAALAYTKGFCVRINGVGYSTVFENRTMCRSGIYHGIFLYPEDAERFEKKHEVLSRNTDETSVSLLVDTDVSFNMSVRGRFIFVAPADGNVEWFDKDPRWISYIESPYHPAPDTVFMDRSDFADGNQFFSGPLGEYLLKTSTMTDEKTEDTHYVASLQKR